MVIDRDLLTFLSTGHRVFLPNGESCNLKYPFDSRPRGLFLFHKYAHVIMR